MAGFQGIRNRGGVLTVIDGGQSLTVTMVDTNGKEKSRAAIEAELNAKKGRAVPLRIELHKTPSGRVFVGWQGPAAFDYGQPFNWAEADRVARA